MEIIVKDIAAKKAGLLTPPLSDRIRAASDAYQGSPHV